MEINQEDIVTVCEGLRLELVTYHGEMNDYFKLNISDELETYAYCIYINRPTPPGMMLLAAHARAETIKRCWQLRLGPCVGDDLRSHKMWLYNDVSTSEWHNFNATDPLSEAAAVIRCAASAMRMDEAAKCP